MSYILGLTQGGASNPSAALLKDGKLIACAEEERFNRLKCSPKKEPESSIEFCLQSAGISAKDLDEIAVAWMSPKRYVGAEMAFALRRPPVLFLAPYNMRTLRDLKTEFLKDKRKISYCPHHLAHVSSSFYASGMKKANVISIDGRGEIDSTIIGTADKEGIDVVKSFSYLNSLGDLFERFTHHLGFIPHRHEGKVMGLAAYGKTLPKKDVDRIIKIHDSGYKIESIDHYLRSIKIVLMNLNKLHLIDQKSIRFNNGLLDRHVPKREKGKAITQKHMDLAATIQSIYEDVLIRLSRYMHERTGMKNFTLSGGCTLNCTGNGSLQKQFFVDDIFIPPAANDAGCSIGAALYIYNQEKRSNFKMEHAYWGPEYSDEEIERALKKSRLKYHRSDDISGDAADLISKGNIIGWFQGKMELGPRALGNRSILADPSDPKMKDKINRQVKHREPWRPFAPTILENHAKRYLHDYRYSPFMLMAFKAKNTHEIPAVMHVDDTTRPQILRKDINKRYHNLISKFHKESGIPAVLNTSFNGQEEPIVCSPEDAINSYKKIGLDALAIGNFLIS